MRKIIMIGISLCVLIAGILFAIHQSKYISGSQWSEKQEEYMDEFGVIADDMDNTMTLYMTDAITTEDFLSHVDIIQKEVNILRAGYDQYQDKHPVKIGSYSYHEKATVDAVAKLFDLFNEILNMMRTYADDKPMLSYEYIAYHQDIIKIVSEYVTARNFIDGTFKSNKEEEK